MQHSADHYRNHVIIKILGGVVTNAKSYRLEGGINRSIFRTQLQERFSKNGSFSSNAIQSAVAIIGLIESDPSIKDIRWAAYMLATILHETKNLVSASAPARNRKGQQLLDKNGKPVTLSQKKWVITMNPINEVGHGKNRRYQDPVKVKILSNQSARITEQDGDQFLISASGTTKFVSPNASMGSDPQGPRSKIYESDDGVEKSYFGRGYVQLTWWSNYAKAGIDIGVGFKLLLDPEEVLTPSIAYALMSYGMVNGKIFANGHKFSQYFSGSSTNYVAARRMVNGQDQAAEIAKIAEIFEEVIFASISKSTSEKTP